MPRKKSEKNTALNYTVKLIERSLVTQNPYLDIGCCNLRDEDLESGSVIGHLLGQCTHLETLILSNEWYEDGSNQRSVNTLGSNFFTQPIFAISQLINLNKLICSGSFEMSWRISDLGFIKNLKGLKELNLSYNHIGEIKHIDGLINLNRLVLSVNQIKEIKNLQGLKSLNHLDLEVNQIREIKNLDSLTSLRQLNLGFNQISDIDNLINLTALKELNLSRNQIKEIDKIDNLIDLEKLSLAINQIREIKNLEKLTSLRKLYLRNNTIYEIKNLDNLISLNELDLSYNQISEIINLESLTCLVKLYLNDNQINEIKNLSDLKLLKELFLGSNKIIEIEGLEGLTAIDILDLSYNQISEIKKLNDLVALNELFLHYNHISELKMLDALICLNKLYLNHNQISEIKNLEGLAALTVLDLQSNQISVLDLPNYILEKNDLNLYLHGNPLKIEYDLRFSENKNSLPYIKDWLNKQKSANKIAITYPLKVLLLGNHGVGKSSLVNFLKNIITKGSTHILRILPYKQSQANLPSALFFDFGGQDFYHGIYRAFFSNGGLQIILYDSDLQNNGIGKDVENTLIYNYNLAYWLGQKNYIEAKNNSLSEPYFLVESYAERGKGEQQYMSLKKEDGLKKKFYLSLKSETDLNEDEKINLAIYKADKANFKIHFDHSLEQLAVKGTEPKWFIDFLQFIYTNKKKQFQPSNIAKDVLPHFKIDYEQNKEKQIEILKRYLQQLHISGLVLYYKDITELEDFVWLNPEALVSYIQKKILSKSVINVYNGILAETVFKKLVNDEKILAFLKAQKVVYLHQPDYNDASKNEFIIPNYLPIANVDDTNYQLFTFGITQPSFILKFKDFIPFGLINEMICFFGQQPDAKRFWRNQLLFTYQKETRVLITICYEDLTIRVCVHSTNQNKIVKPEIISYLFYTTLFFYCDIDITDEIFLITNDENVEKAKENIKGVFFTPQALNRLKAYDKLTESIFLTIHSDYFVNYHQLKELPTAESQIIAYGLDNNSCIDLTKTKAVPTNPLGQIIGKHFTKMKKIFISYSKYDEDYKEEFRKHLVTLRDKKLIEDFNCKQIDLGAAWDATIQKEVDDCDFMFCLVSVDFLNTPYIRRYEIVKAIENGKTLIPIIIKPCDWEESEIGQFFAAERGHTISLNKEKLLDNFKVLANTPIERAAYWVNIVQEFRAKMLK